MTQLVSTLTTRGVKHETSEPTLLLENITVAYAPGSQDVTSQTSKQFALKNVSCQIERGERVAIVGPNGAGKSTFFKLIVGTLKPQQGHIRIYGHQPGGHICIAYVPQRSQIDWSFPVTVEDVVMMGRVGQIGFFRRPKKQDWSFVGECLERVSADHLAKKQIGELSGGQQQRIFIARALAQEAELLLLDEPLTGLDVPSQEKIFAILDNLRPDGVTVLVATHDLNMAAERFDRVMLLNRQIVGFGEPTAVLQANNLVRAYGGHLHVVGDEQNTMILADGCCDDHEAEEVVS
ncbi:MAG: metal ABC transporter ATP-binding protein [Chloroflexi bacterium]|nr:MAG: metal ABC transporter ATP-binding protein [Chloroflexota bacterium]